MLLDGVHIDDRDVPQLARLVPPALGRKLLVAHTFRSQVVALTSSERDHLVAAVLKAPAELDEVRDRILSRRR
jgi:hypothetical protein